MSLVISSSIAMAMDDTLELDHSVHSNNTTTSAEYDHDYGCNWQYSWPPVDDWEAFAGRDDFRDLIGSMMDDGGLSFNLQHPCEQVVEEGISSNSGMTADSIEMVVDEETKGDDSKGLKLVHLLMAAAEALTGANKSRDLARVILVRLKEMVSPTDGTNMERLAAYFTEVLYGLLEGVGGVHPKHLTNNGPHRDEQHHHTDLLAAFQLLQDMSPYVKFGHFTANQAILEEVAQDRRVHIVDFDIMEGIQWASLMQSLAPKKDGPPAPHLRITAISRGGSGSGRRSIGTIQETGRRLTDFAASIGQPFSFHQCRLDKEETFRPSALKLVRGEALVVNCILHLPHFNHRAPQSVASFLSGAKTLNPRIVTLVEEEVGPIGGGFMDTLHHYSAVFDSLEADFPMHSRSRALVERVFLVPRISASLARVYLAGGLDGDDESLNGPWGEWLAAGGFRPVPISYANHCQAKLLLGLFNDGYRVEELANNKIALGWKSRRLLSASVWSTTPASEHDL